jgi:hypothetical protein
MYHLNGFFSVTEGWDPPPFRTKPDAQWRQQYHLRFTCSGLAARRSLGVVLCPGSPGRSPAPVQCERVDGAEIAHIGGGRVLVGQGAPIAYDGVRSDALAIALLDGRAYEVWDDGVRVR